MLEIYNNSQCPTSKSAIIHCVSADGAMGAGFARSIPYAHKKIFRDNKPHKVGTCFFTYLDYNGNKVENDLNNACIFAHLVTKELAHHKPTYQALGDALQDFVEKRKKSICLWESVTIGCGLDRLHWERVKTMIENIVINKDKEIAWIVHIPRTT